MGRGIGLLPVISINEFFHSNWVLVSNSLYECMNYKHQSQKVFSCKRVSTQLISG